MPLSIRRVLLGVFVVCCTCLVVMGFMENLSSLFGAFGWLTAGVFAFGEIFVVNLEQRIVLEAAAEIKRMKEKENE